MNGLAVLLSRNAKTSGVATLVSPCGGPAPPLSPHTPRTPRTAPITANKLALQDCGG